jgi:tRNA pseudouridine55 synthase
MQVPPQVSAVKVAGERAYDLARAGETVDLAPRPLWVESLRMMARPDQDTAEFEMVCGKGGYVRSVARDLGRALGCLGHVLWLRRIWSGPFRADEAVTLDRVEALARTDGIDGLVLPLAAGLTGLPEVRATEDGAARLRHGNPGHVIPAQDLPYGTEAWASLRGAPVAIGRYLGGELHPTRVFNL